MFKRILLLISLIIPGLLMNLHAGATPGAPPASSSSNGTNLPLPLGATNYIQSNPAAAQSQGFNVGGSTLTNLIVTGIIETRGPAIISSTEPVLRVTVNSNSSPSHYYFSPSSGPGGSGGGDVSYASTGTFTAAQTFSSFTVTGSSVAFFTPGGGGMRFFEGATGGVYVDAQIEFQSGIVSTNSFRAGTTIVGGGSGAGTPDIRSNNDGDTGLVWNGGDSLSISAGGVARLNVISTLVGIGTLNPSSKLDVFGGSITIRGANAGLAIPNLGSSAGTALVIDNAAGGNVFLQTSSRRFKHDIKQVRDWWWKVLLLTPVTFAYNSNNSVDFGYIAEQVDELGLKNLVNYDGEGKPFSLKYDRVAIYAIGVIGNLIVIIFLLIVWVGVLTFIVLRKK